MAFFYFAPLYMLDCHRRAFFFTTLSIRISHQEATIVRGELLYLHIHVYGVRLARLPANARLYSAKTDSPHFLRMLRISCGRMHAGALCTRATPALAFCGP